MSSFFYPGHHQQPHVQNPHAIQQSHNHHGRSRRAPRLSASQNSHRQQYRPKPSIKAMEATEPPSITAFRARFEAGRSFDLDDDLEFCPNLLTLDERQSIHSASSDQSSLSSGSPGSSPLQQQIQPQQQVTPALSLSSAAHSNYVSQAALSNSNANRNNNNNGDNLKIYEPVVMRPRNAIPIVNPSTGMRVASPPSSISPGIMQSQTAAGRW